MQAPVGKTKATPEPVADAPDESRDPRLRIGAMWAGRYRLRRLLGEGGAAAVFAAEHVHINRSIALKLPHLDLDMKETLFARLRREMLALSRVRHPAIVDVVDGGDAEGVPFIAMDLLEGRTLSGLIAARGRLETMEVVKIGVDLAAGLAAVHAAGIVHRDVKPSNVVITRDLGNQVRLLDFGTAKLADVKDTIDTKLTQNGAILGTPEYMAPESILSLPGADHRADVYALGVTLYECLTGAVPYDGPIGQILMKLSASDAPSLTSARADVPKQLADVIHKSLRRDATERWATMGEFASALAECTDQRLSTIDILHGAARDRPGAPSVRQPMSVAIPPVAGPAAAAPAAAAAPETRRVHARAPYVTLCRLAREKGKATDGRVEDVSEGGVLLVANEACSTGEVIRLRFALPISGKVIDISAKAQWSRASRGGRATGFQFIELTDPARAEIRQYIGLMGGS
ncbi:MAG TPA: serine/threonine-protein kinase [Polyangiaceae bacterium]|nr:serine/threonine-protein kinase [Polyangiaceae bacterium]